MNTTVVPLDPKPPRSLCADGQGPHGRLPRPLLHQSRRYSVTLGQLRRAWPLYRRLLDQAPRNGKALDTRDIDARLLAADEDDTTLVVGQWAYIGTGWPRTGGAALAVAAAARAREYGQWKAAHRNNR